MNAFSLSRLQEELSRAAGLFERAASLTELLTGLFAISGYSGKASGGILRGF